MYFCHAGETEIGGFGVTAEGNPTYVERFETLAQATTAASVEFADDAVADYFDRCVDEGLNPHRFARIWIHTHPGASPEPSATDEETLARVFGGCDWSLMFIVSRTARAYARLTFAAGPGGSMQIPIDVDWGDWPRELSNPRLDEHVRAWRAEYEGNVHPLVSTFLGSCLDERWGDELDQLADDSTESASFAEYFETLAELRGEVAS